MSTQTDIIANASPTFSQKFSAGAQINRTIARAFLPRLKNKMVALACTNPQHRRDYSDELTKEQSPKKGRSIDIRIPHFLNAVDDAWDINTKVEGLKGTGQAAGANDDKVKDINSYPDWLLNVALDQHIVLPLQHSTTMKMFLVNLDEWVEPATDKLANRIDVRFLNMIATRAGGSGAQVTNKNGRFTYEALEYVRGRIEGNGEIGENLCAVMPTKLRHKITGDFSRGVQQYPEADVKALTVKGAIGNMGGINVYVSTYVPTHICGAFTGALTVKNTALWDNLRKIGSGPVGDNQGYRVQTKTLIIQGLDPLGSTKVLGNDNGVWKEYANAGARTAAGATAPAEDNLVTNYHFKPGDEFVVGGQTSEADGVGEVNLYNGESTGNYQVFTVVSSTTLHNDTQPADSDGDVATATTAEVTVSPGLFSVSNASTGAYKGLTRLPAAGDHVFMAGRPGQTYDQVLIWNKMMAAFLPVMIPELPNVINKTVRDSNSGLTFNVATDSDIDNRTTITRWDGFWGMDYFAYGNNDICRLKVQATDFSKDGVRDVGIASGDNAAARATKIASATATTDFVDNADTTYTNIHNKYYGGLMPTCVVPVQPDSLTRTV